jgi:hypothetical protein
MPRTSNAGKARPRRRAPALTPEDREDQLISLAIDLAEKRLIDGTAPNSVINHYLKLGSTRERLEKEKLQKENELLRAKTESLQSMKDIQELYQNALDAMRSYSYNDGDDDDYDYDD